MNPKLRDILDRIATSDNVPETIVVIGNWAQDGAVLKLLAKYIQGVLRHSRVITTACPPADLVVSLMGTDPKYLPRHQLAMLLPAEIVTAAPPAGSEAAA